MLLWRRGAPDALGRGFHSTPVAWCDDEGRVCVAGAFCPHLGSHMGPTVGGLVRDGCLVCPFHGFQAMKPSKKLRFRVADQVRELPV